jgi:hypothetical protein
MTVTKVSITISDNRLAMMMTVPHGNGLGWRHSGSAISATGDRRAGPAAERKGGSRARPVTGITSGREFL